MADFGAQLREARERKGISLRQIAASTKISVAALEGLERNDISKLPGGIFSRAFVRSYAIEVGLDPDETVRQFLQQFAGDAPMHGSAPPAAAPPRQPSPPPARAVSAGSRPPSAGGRPETHAEARGVREEVDFESKQKMAAVVLKLVLVSLPFAAGIIYFSSRGSASRPATSAVPRPEASAAQEPGPAKSDRAEPAAELPGASAAATPPAARAGAVVVTPTPPEERAAADASAPMRLDVVPTADCWIKLTVDGSVAVSRVIPAGERESRAFAESAVLIVGDAGACAIAINGQAAKPLGREKQVREIRVTRDNFRTFLP